MTHICIQPLTKFQYPIPEAETLTAATIIDMVKTLGVLKNKKETHKHSATIIKLFLTVL